MEALLMGLGTTAAALITLSRVLGLRGIAQHATKVDVGLTLVYFLVFAGTSTTGIFTAMLAGLFTALATTGIKKFYDWKDEGVEPVVVVSKHSEVNKPLPLKVAVLKTVATNTLDHAVASLRAQARS